MGTEVCIRDSLDGVSGFVFFCQKSIPPDVMVRYVPSNKKKTGKNLKKLKILDADFFQKKLHSPMRCLLYTSDAAVDSLLLVSDFCLVCYKNIKPPISIHV